jgi:biotin carboxyl carrier protein
MIFAYQHNDVTYTVNLEPAADGGYTAVIDGRKYVVRAQMLPEGGWLVEMGDQRWVCCAAAQGKARFVHLNGQSYTLSVPDARSQRRSSAASGGDLTAQMPGQVVNVLVAEGDAVTRGQTLLTLEAMKMEIRVAAPGDGHVKRLLVKSGAMVERGQRLVELET